MNFTYDEIDRMYDAAKSLAHRRSQLKSKGWAFVAEQYDWIKYNQKYWNRSPKDFVSPKEYSSFRYLVNQIANA